MFERAESLVKSRNIPRRGSLLLQSHEAGWPAYGARQLLVVVQQNLALRQRAGQIKELKFQVMRAA